MKRIWISMCFVRAWNWEFFVKAMTFWLSSYIIIVWKYSTLHVNWIIRFRNQIISFAINACFVYSISQINNVTINQRFENQLMISLLRWIHILKLIVWYFDFLLNSNSCNSLKILMFREISISFDMFLVNSEKCVWLFVNEFK
jgi:signal transduction histidine kinase